MVLPTAPPRTTPRPKSAPPTRKQSTIASNENSLRSIVLYCEAEQK